MNIRDVLQKMKEKKEAKKQAFRQLQESDQMQTMLEERKLSANQRELERYYKEDSEKSIKEALQIARKKRSDDINFNHNPIDAKNIMKSEWEVLKEKNQFAGKSNMFENNNFIHKNNKNLLKSGNMLNHKGNMFNQKSNMFNQERNILNAHGGGF